ncbi:NUMOD4 domain-containing protein [Komagataeibacter rhaeticus]
MKEEWKSIPDFPDYAASSLGRIKRVVPDRHGRIITSILKIVTRRDGYCTVTLHRNARQATFLVHRLICTTFHGNAPSKKHHAAHNNGIKANNSAGNVRWASPHENNMDKHRHGTMKTGSDHHAIKKPECMPRGILHGNAKVNDADVIAIRSDNRPQTKIADQYGISQSLVSQIKRKTIWRHI